MEGLLHALTLITLMVATVRLCRRYGTRPDKVLPSFISILAPLLMLISMFADSRFPLRQWMIVILCGVFLLCEIRWSHRHIPAFIVLMLGLGVLFHWHHQRLLTLPYYTEWPARERARPVIITPSWHSHLTGIYAHRPSLLEDMEGREWELGRKFADEFQCREAIIKPAWVGYSWQGDIQAIVLLLMLATTGWMLLRHHGADLSGQRICYTIGLFILAMLLLTPLWWKKPFAWQMLIPSTCCALMMGMTRLSTRAVIILGLSMALISILLVRHAEWLTEPKEIESHRFTWFGPPATVIFANYHPTPWKTETDSYHIAMAQYLIREIALHDTKEYPPGWLKEQPFYQISKHQVVFTHSRALWHTRLTGLYRDTGVRSAVWYPGGRIRDALPRLSVRPYRH